MPRYTATIEFNSNVLNISVVEEDLKQYLSLYKNLNIKNVTKTSISPEQALREIRGLTCNSTGVYSDAILDILNKVD
jgi:hypothetical protein